MRELRASARLTEDSRRYTRAPFVYGQCSARQVTFVSPDLPDGEYRISILTRVSDEVAEGFLAGSVTVDRNHVPGEAAPEAEAPPEPAGP